MNDTPESANDIIEDGLRRLLFQVKDAIIKVRNGDLIDLSNIDEDIDYFCDLSQNGTPELKEAVKPLLEEAFTELETLSRELNEVLETEEEGEDGDEEFDENETEENGSPLNTPKGKE